MELIDTHTHLFAEEFDEDRHQVVERAIEAGVSKMLLPNIDEGTVEQMLELHRQFPEHCLPMIGVHPSSIGGHWEQQVAFTRLWLQRETFYGVGEIGVDLYWDTTYKDQQLSAFAAQIELARENNLPFVIHSRNSYEEIFQVLKSLNHATYRGIFHSYAGSAAMAAEAVEMGFMIGAGGISTFKNAGVDKVIATVPLSHLVLETDSPYLAPTPKRGKRNESAYVAYVNEKLAAIHQKTPEETAFITTKNAKALFGLE